ncbi:MAG: D-alanine--poly(phosphoribitol) ligase subunit DltA [Coriobacteriaceae bacterium]|jgi:D-alanine--poly(phosphoribitol) ligase subunit 1|nr:D-alanine--poly(phosphoribitol) ligase subunit DltA [Coriobacteriaceae bacterium]
MSEFVNAVDAFGVRNPDVCAFRNSRGESITYGELKAYSDSLAAWVSGIDATREPLVVYGHKTPFMLVAFLACVKSGHAYVPIDTNLPKSRAIDILGQLGKPLMLNTLDEGIPDFDDFVSLQIDLNELRRQAQAASRADLAAVAGDECFYIMFTSGSTGAPKGVEITASCLDNFWKWMVAEFPQPQPQPPAQPQVFFDRAPFSFDLSLTDIALGLGTGNTMFSLESEDEADLARSFDALEKANPHFWVSTASFADMCLRDPRFSSRLLPRVKTFFFVGETLKNETAGALLERFRGCEVVNGYGPTESTDLVTSVRITPQMVASVEPLPVGKARPGTDLVILDPDTMQLQPTGQAGELFIIGDTVAKGYFRRPDLTEAAFCSCPAHLCQGRRSYRTGDSATLDTEGMLHFHGRLDFQIKLHGYRIELGDIESNLRRLDLVADACVLPVWRKGAITHMAAYVVLAEGAAGQAFDLAQQIKAGLRGLVPEYMVPRKVVCIGAFPLNTNGKIDRDRLRGMG